MKPAARLLCWCSCLLLACLWQGAFAASPASTPASTPALSPAPSPALPSVPPDVDAGDAYGFASAKAYLEMQSRDLADVMNRFDNDLFQDLDVANAVNIKYRSLPPNYVLYRLKLAENIEKNAGKPDRLATRCRQFLFIENAEKNNAAKFMAYNEAMTEKFIPRDAYQVMDEDALRNVLVKYLATYSMVYAFKNSDAIRIRIEKAIPYKNDEGDIGVLYSIGLDEKDAADESAPERFFQVTYCNGDIVSFEPSANDPADVAVMKICSSRQ